MKMGITTCLKETANIPNQISTLYFLLGILLALMLASGENISTYSTVGTEAVTSVNTTADVTQQPTGNTAGTANITLYLNSTSAGIATTITNQSPTTTGNIVFLSDTTVNSSTNTKTEDAATITTTQPLTSMKSTGGSSSTATTLPLLTTSTPTGTAITTHSTTAIINSSSVEKPQSLTTTTTSGDPVMTTIQSFAVHAELAQVATTNSTATSTNPARTSTVTTTSVGTAIMPTQAPSTTFRVSLTTSSVPSGSITVPTSSSSSVSSTYTMFTNSLNTTNALTATNVTTESFGSMSMISCPAFTCNFSDCYTMFTNENATTCRAAAYCELIRQEDMGYSVNCTTACAKSCVNTSGTNCSVKCCNATGCLNDTFVSMMMGTITEGVTSNVPDTTPTTTGTKPTMENSNKCHAGTCIGVTCYTDFAKNPPQSCSASQAHCQLMKETMNSNTKWTAGCTTNCSGKTTCKATTPPPCYLECCNTTLTSCLWLNGTLNVFSSAERIFHLNAELVASFLCVFAISLVI